MLFSKNQIFTGNSKEVFHYGKLSKLMLKNNPLIRFCFKNPQFSFFGIIVGYDDHKYASIGEYIICAPKSQLENFSNQPVHEREIRKIIPKKLNITQTILCMPGIQLIHDYLPGFDEVVLPTLRVQESFVVRVYEDTDEYAFVRVFAKKEIPFSVCGLKDITNEKPLLPMIFESSANNATNPIKIFVAESNSSSKTHLIKAQGISLSSMGSVVFDYNTGKFFAMICEIKTDFYAHCASLLNIYNSFADWNNVHEL